MSTADVATDYVRRMVAKEARGWGDTENAISRLEQKFGLPFWTLNHIRTGRAKTVEAGLFQRIRAAYVTYCEQQVRQLQHEIAIEKALGDDVDLEDLEKQVAALAAQIRAKKRSAR